MSTFLSIDGGRGILPTVCVEADVTNPPTNPTRVWTGITPLVRQIQFTRSGRNDEFQRTSTGRLSAKIDDRGGAFTGLNPAKAQWVRVRAEWQGTTYQLWQGIISSLVRQWPQSGRDATVNMQAMDVLQILRVYNLQGETFPSQRCDQRIVTIAGLAGVATGTIDTDTDTADAVTSPLAATDALTTCLDIEQSENGLLIADPAGTVSFQGRHWRLLNSADAKGVFGETAGDIPYKDSAAYQDDDSWLANYVSVTPYNASDPIVVEDTGSITQFFKRYNQTVDRTLVTSDTAIAQACAEYLLARYRSPSPRLPEIEMSLAAVGKSGSTLPGVILAAQNSDRFVWTRAASVAVSTDVFVEQISHTIAPNTRWDVKFEMSPAADQNGWVLGDDTYSNLGESTVVIY